MLEVSQAYYEAKNQPNNKPLVMLTLINAWGMYAWSDQQPTDVMMGAVGDVHLANGAYLADGSIEATSGGQVMLGWSARAMSFGGFSESVAARGLLGSVKVDEAANMTIVLDNRDNVFTQIVASQNLIGAEGLVQVGYHGIDAADFVTRFRGRVVRASITRQQCQLYLRAA